MKEGLLIKVFKQVSITNQDRLFHWAAITNTGCKTVITKVITENTRIIFKDNIEESSLFCVFEVSNIST